MAGKRVRGLGQRQRAQGRHRLADGPAQGLRAQQIALENKLPLVYLVESGGANLMYQSEMFVEGGRSFANQARLSAAGIPQIAVVHGSSTAGGAYLPGLSDYVVLVRGRSSIYLAGPPLVKAAIGEDATDEELGGAQTHAEVTGLGEYLGENDAHAIAIARELVDKLQWDAAPPAAPSRRAAVRRRGADGRRAGRRARALRRARGHRAPGRRLRLPRVQARLRRRHACAATRASTATLVGIIGNNGPIQPNGANKAAQFIQLCDQTGTPLVFLQNTTGYMVGSAAERGGAIKHGAKMIQAVANARVPKFTFVIGGSFGAGNYGMCGRGFDPRFIFSWPSARTAVMGGAQAGKVMEIVGARQARARRRRRPTTTRWPRWATSCASASTANRTCCSAPRACGTTASSTRATRAACSALALALAREAERAHAATATPSASPASRPDTDETSR